MEYHETITLRDGRPCILRNSTEHDAREERDVFILTHGETDWLLSYPDEITMTVEEEAAYFRDKAEADDEIDIAAVVEGRIVGSAGIERVGRQEKLRHRAELGISVIREFWGLGIGRALLRACIACARRAGYLQLELDVVGDNERAIALYQSEGFVEYGRNPQGFRSRTAGMQELVLMRLEL